MEQDAQAVVVEDASKFSYFFINITFCYSRYSLVTSKEFLGFLKKTRMAPGEGFEPSSSNGAQAISSDFQAWAAIMNACICSLPG